MGRTSRTAFRARWGEADPLGIVFSPNILSWFDQATHELMRGPDQTIASFMSETGYAMPIAECGVRFHAPVYYDDELVVVSTVVDLRKRSFRLDHVLERDGEPLATGFEVRVVARRDPASGRLEKLEIPERIRAWLAGE